MKNKLLIGIGFLCLFLILTNPTMNDFKNFGAIDYQKRERNFILFSIYSANHELYPDRYFAIAKNFFDITPHEKYKEEIARENEKADRQAYQDSVAMAQAAAKAAEKQDSAAVSIN